MGKEERFYIGLKDRKKIPVFSETLFTITIGIRKPIRKGRRQLLQISLSEECECTVCCLFPCFSISLDIIPVLTNSSHISLFCPPEEAIG
jgi:hypothetical protein